MGKTRPPARVPRRGDPPGAQRWRHAEPRSHATSASRRSRCATGCGRRRLTPASGRAWPPRSARSSAACAGRTASCPLGAPVGMPLRRGGPIREAAAAGGCVTPQLARDRRRRATELGCDLAYPKASRRKDGDLLSLGEGQITAGRWKGA